MRLVMIGTGYVGLVSGACFSDFGHDVLCIDKDKEKISSLSAGKVSIFEPSLERMVQENIAKKRLRFSSNISDIKGAEIIFIAVGTPARRGDGHADLGYVFEALEEMLPHLQDGMTLVTKSTVPVGTASKIEQFLAEKAKGITLAVASNPEFMREGAAIRDFKLPDRIVIGTNSPHAMKQLEQAYRPLYLNKSPLFCTTPETAELIKYASNAFLATKIGFINEMSDLCEKLGADIQQLARAIGMDKRIGAKFLHPGPGFGGSCFPKDIIALERMGEEAGSAMPIVKKVRQRNEDRKTQMAERIDKACNGVKGKKLAILGVTFKPNTDDMRQAPSLTILPLLQKMGAEISVYDPQGKKEGVALLKGVTWAKDEKHAAKGADALIILTEWEAFRALNLQEIKALLTTPFIIDLRNIYTLQEMEENGFSYHSLGRKTLKGGK